MLKNRDDGSVHVHTEVKTLCIRLDGGFVDRYLSAEKVQKQHIKTVGLEIGPTYHALYDDCV